MGVITDTKALIAAKLGELASFSDADIKTYRPVDLVNVSGVVAAKLSGLSVFVSMERIQKGDEDEDPNKRVSYFVEVWTKPLEVERSTVTAPLTENDRDVEEMIFEAIKKLEVLVTEEFDPGQKKQRLAFQDAFRVEVPPPYLVYRIIMQTTTVIGNE